MATGGGRGAVSRRRRKSPALKALIDVTVLPPGPVVANLGIELLDALDIATWMGTYRERLKRVNQSERLSKLA